MNGMQTEMNFIHKTMRIHFDIPSFVLVCSEHSCVVLKATGKKLEKAFNDGKRASDLLDEIIYDRLSKPETQILEYLSLVHKNCEDEKSKGINLNKKDILSLLNLIQKIVLDYSFSNLTIEEKLFPKEVPKSMLSGTAFSAFKVVFFLQNTENFSFISLVFGEKTRENSRFFEELGEYIAEIIESKLNNSDLTNDMLCVYLRILDKMIDLGVISSGVINKSLCDSQFSEPGVEKNNLFGSILALPVLPKKNHLIPVYRALPADAVKDFIQHSNQREQQRSIEILRVKHERFVLESYNIFKRLIRTNQSNTLDFLKKIVSLNYVKSKFDLKSRIAVQFKQFSDSFCVNLLDILLTFCEPFAKFDEPRLEKVLKNHLKIDQSFREILSTPIIVRKSQVFESKVVGGTISHYFYCTLLMLRFGWTTLKKLAKYIAKLSLNVEASDSLKTYFNGLIMSFGVILFNEKRNIKILNFYLVFCELLLKWNKFSGSLPLKDPDESLCYIPEYILKDLAGFVIYHCELDINKMFTVLPKHASGSTSRFLTFTTVLLSSRELFPNVKVANKFIYSVLLLFKTKVLSEHSDILKSNQVVREYLVTSLLNYYSLIEKYHFYDIRYKLIFRQNTGKLIFKLLTVQYFCDKIIEIQYQDVFSQFITFLLDEITKFFEEGLTLIEQYKELLEKSASQPDLAESLNQKEGICKIYWTQININLKLLLKFSVLKLDILVSEMIGKRFAAFLNQFLFSLHGPNYMKIKLEHPEKINFKHKKVMLSILNIYINFSTFQEFYDHVVSDARFFNISVFERTRKIIIKNRSLASNEEQEKFSSFYENLLKFSKVVMINTDDAPDEFLCQITMELMKNPVVLPSGAVVDRSNIERHLISSKFDPFTRQEMTISDVKENLELKESIQEWINKKRMGS